jgi:hypothetical protein
MNEEYRNYDAGRSKRTALDETTIRMEEQRLQQSVASNYLRLISQTQRLAHAEISPVGHTHSVDRPHRGATTFVVLPRGNRQDRPHWLIELQISKSTPTAYGIEIAGDVVLGVMRYGNKRPDLDLALYSGDEKGVSRRHAMLCPEFDSLMLVDLYSTNGTWLNNVRLEPHRPHALSNGDIVSLGLLTFIVHIASTPRDLGDGTNHGLT